MAIYDDVKKEFKKKVSSIGAKAYDATVGAVKEIGRNELASSNIPYVPGTLKSKQDKMIKTYVDKQPSKIPTYNRTQSNVIKEEENLDKSTKNKFRKKGIYK